MMNRDEPLDLRSHRGGRDESGASVHLNNHDSNDPRRLKLLNFKNYDPCLSMRLEQYFSDLEYPRKKQAHNDINFTTSAVGLIELGNVVYNKLCEISPTFGQHVSSSMFMYYVGQLHYMRLFCLEFAESRPVAEDLRVMNNLIRGNTLVVPQLLADYFKSIGYFRDCTGILARHREIACPSADDIEGINGYFGRVDSNTHVHYENRISPGVAAKRIVEDLIFTIHPFGRLQCGLWDLPQILVPADRNAVGPTANLLGWSPATYLTADQIAVLKRCGVFINIAVGKMADVSFYHQTRFCHNDHLMCYISTCLKELMERVKCEDSLNTEPVGSLAQRDYQVVAHPGDLSIYNVYGNITYNGGFAPLRVHQELLAHAFRLRIVKNAIDIVTPHGFKLPLNPWCCYDFKGYREVPKSWCETCNAYVTYGVPKPWHFAWYRSQAADGRILLNNLMAKALIP